MALAFETTINLTTANNNPTPKYVRSLMIINEPKNNNITQFYTHNNLAGDKATVVNNADYPTLAWDNPATHLTNQYVNHIGAKHFPQIGAMAFYTLLHEERSYLLCPVFINKERYTRPTFSVVQSATSLTFTMVSPADITYICWRIILRLGNTAFEYISYSNTLTVDLPYPTGTYDCYCVGYIGEGQAISDDSNHISLNITGTGIDPRDAFAYYTKGQIDNMIDANKAGVLSVTLTTADWIGSTAPYTQTISVPGVVLTGYSYVASPAASNWSDYCKYGIYMNEPTTAGQVTFYAISDKPISDLTVNILKVGVHT